MKSIRQLTVDAGYPPWFVNYLFRDKKEVQAALKEDLAETRKLREENMKAAEESRFAAVRVKIKTRTP